MSRRHVELAIFWIVPAAVLLTAFIWLGVLTGTPWPWNVVVHEDGLRTLLGTVFFVAHATRELIPDAILAVAVAGAVRYFFPPDVNGAEARRWRTGLALFTGLALAALAGATAWTEGVQSFIDNFAQFHTRAGAPLVWGAHWRYHLIERLAQMTLAFSVSGIVWRLQGRPQHRPGRGLSLYGSALAAWCVLTVVFRPTLEPFRDPAFLGHQLRELFTHTLVTLPLALGTCFVLARRFSTASGEPSNAPIWPIAATGAMAVACGAFLLLASLLTDAQSHGQTQGLPWLLLPHFFEHAIGYVLVPALAGWAYVGRGFSRA